ncbi:hypothetical protein LVK03_03235 [Tenacibaculum maritimum]|uniref:hypothetical protein n=1 Tax=Tenacibaculum maritimum TaxID=107401 RepID=UPI001E53EE2F|nr:hypothetical protein [Tenacibaculum maritimum]MCD9584089.1 hypothetical protein [Tenacibaculum maritimum]
MILSHLVLGFVTSYIGYTPPSMLNITASKIYVENNKRVARQFIKGVSFIVLFQVFLAIKLSELIGKYPSLIVKIQSLGTAIFLILSIVFICKGLAVKEPSQVKSIKNGFIFGAFLSSINMFSIPFFAILHSSFIMYGWATSGIICTTMFGLGTVLGTFAVLYSYLFLTKKIRGRLLHYTKYFNLVIGIITGVVAIYSMIKLYSY